MIHSFEKLGNFFVIDVGSGAVHVLDELAYSLCNELNEDDLRKETLPSDRCKKLSRYSKEELEFVFRELQELYEQGLLYSNDDYSEFSGKLETTVVKAMCLHVAHDCNLRCAYCFASTGDFGGQRKLMDIDTAKKAMDLLVSLSGTRHHLEVDFFGGEPLMNFELVRQTVSYARSLEKTHNKQFRFTLTTNGLLLNDENIDYINREMSNVVLSLDGRKSVNDSMRPTMAKTGSYDTIVPKLQKLVRTRGGKEYYVRGTYTRNNLDFHKDVLHLHELGFEQISVEPVVGPEEDAYSIRTEDLNHISNSYQKLLEHMTDTLPKTPFHFFHFLLDLDNGPCAIKRIKGCGCGNEYLAVTPEGELYPCHQFVGKTEFKMGDVSGGVDTPHLQEQFAKAHLLNKQACTDCWAKFYCSGGCNANNHSFNQDILVPHTLSCALEKERLECAIALSAEKSNCNE